MKNKQIKHLFFLVSICITLFICMYYGLVVIQKLFLQKLIFQTPSAYVYSIGEKLDRAIDSIVFIDGDYYFNMDETIYKNDFELVNPDNCGNGHIRLEKDENCLLVLGKYKDSLNQKKIGEFLHQFSFQDSIYNIYEHKIEEKFQDSIYTYYFEQLDNGWKYSFIYFVKDNQQIYFIHSVADNKHQMRGINYLNKVDMETGTVQQIPLNQSDAVTNITLENNSIIALVNDFEVVPKGHKDRLKHLLSSILYRIDSDTLEKEILYQAKDKQIIIGYHNHFVYVLENKTIHKINVDTKETVKSYRLQVGMDLYICAIKNKLFVYDNDGLRLIIDYYDE